jgi:xylan 1,4-beta-xylosidase
MTVVSNPVLRGFNPDPSILRVGDDFYIATSTFEWFPGVQIHHSRDLVNWKLITRPLDRISQLDLVGCDNSAGVWAPCLSYDKGIFYLVYTIVHTTGHLKDTHNYVVTSPSILGPWSEPVFLHSYGFDPSLFHDTDNKKWIVSMTTEFRKDKNRFGGILMQEYDSEQKKCIGKPVNIFGGTELGKTEGPHLYHIGKWYYLFCAEGGTSYTHAETVARSENIAGPYEVMPGNPLLTGSGKQDLTIMKAGHASIIQLQNGEWIMAHLCGRPVGTEKKYCILGRETSLQNIVFDHEGWPRLADGGNSPSPVFRSPFDAPLPGPEDKLYTFSFEEKLDIDFQSLRIPLSETVASLSARPGCLRLYGHESMSSLFTQALVGRRQQSFKCEVTVKMEFDPEWYKQTAGIAYYYSTREYYYLCVSRDEKTGKVLYLYSCDNGTYDEPFLSVPVGEHNPVWLRIKTDYDKVIFFWSADGKDYIPYGSACDATRISDEHIEGASFTGTFFAMCCQDLSGFRRPADFAFLRYTEFK